MRTSVDPRRVFLTADAVGGVGTYALDLARELGRSGIETVLAVLGPAPSAAQRRAAAAVDTLDLLVADVPLDWTADDAEAVRASARRIARLADAARPDLVHLNAPALAGAAVWPAPVVCGIHSCVATWWRANRQGPPPAAFAWQTGMIHDGLRAADAVIAPSHAFADAVRDIYGRDLPLHVVHNGRRPQANHRDGPRRGVIAAGRLWDEGKGIATLDRAAPLIDAPVAVAGATEGPNGARIALPNIECLGLLDEPALRGRLAAAAIYVSPARYEPFGLTVLEAAQAHLPLVLSDIPVFRELWDGAAAFFPADDHEGLAQAVNALLRDRAARERLAATAARRAGIFTPARLARETCAVYRIARRAPHDSYALAPAGVRASA